MDNEPEDQIEIFGFEMDKDDALHASQALFVGGALVRANSNNKQKQHQAEIARAEQNRRNEIQQVAEEKARQERIFDEANDPCPYCHTQISVQASLCPSCRNGFFGIPWGLIKLALTKDPILVENLTAEKLLTATASVRDEYEAELVDQALERKLEIERKIAQDQKMAIEKENAFKHKVERDKLQQVERNRIFGILAGIVAGMLAISGIDQGDPFPIMLSVASSYLCYYWLVSSKGSRGKQSGHWSEKP